jgi:hypothetical protein
MCEVGILATSIVADYCKYCNRHQVSTMPEAVFYFKAQGQNSLTNHNQPLREKEAL